MKSKRLNALISVLTESETLVDIGADHGFLEFEVLKRKMYKKVLAIDISKNSIDKLNKIKNRFDLKNLFIIKADGLNGIKVDSWFNGPLVIAGLGTKSIIKILDGSNDIFLEYVFVSHRNIKELREYLSKNNYKILYDRILFDNNNYYSIIKAKKVNYLAQKLSTMNLYFGFDDFTNEDFVNYLKMRYLHLNNYLDKIEDYSCDNKYYVEKCLIEEIYVENKGCNK